MGFYERYILPGLLDRLMQNPEMTQLRSRFVPLAQGDILEVGIGSGLNLPFYSDGARSITGLDPSLELQAMARERAAAAGRQVEFIGLSGESIPADNDSFDTVLTTWTLCSIPNPYRALDEMRRVLRPGGRLIFVEHGRAPERHIERWQHRINPLWKVLAGGCNLNRDVPALLAGAGFGIEVIESDYVPGPKFATFMYRGVAAPR